LSSPALFHIIAAEQWCESQASGRLAPPSLASEGFVHLSHSHQVAGVANNLYRDLNGLIVLQLDPGAIGSPVVEEDSYGSGQEFPHVYAAIPAAAVVAVHPLTRAADGDYEFDAIDGETGHASAGR
jgi:uncharacterized protein (DUF952 family)